MEQSFYQGVTIYGLSRLTEDDGTIVHDLHLYHITLDVINEYKIAVVTYSNKSEQEDEQLIVNDDGTIAFVLPSALTARMLGMYHFKISVSYNGSVSVIEGGDLCIQKSGAGRNQNSE